MCRSGSVQPNVPHSFDLVRVRVRVRLRVRVRVRLRLRLRVSEGLVALVLTEDDARGVAALVRLG